MTIPQLTMSTYYNTTRVHLPPIIYTCSYTCHTWGTCIVRTCNTSTDTCKHSHHLLAWGWVYEHVHVYNHKGARHLHVACLILDSTALYYMYVYVWGIRIALPCVMYNATTACNHKHAAYSLFNTWLNRFVHVCLLVHARLRYEDCLCSTYNVTHACQITDNRDSLIPFIWFIGFMATYNSECSQAAYII